MAQIDDVYLCLVCREVLEQPLTTKQCQHTFCSSCVLGCFAAIAADVIPCPLCRSELRKDDLVQDGQKQADISQQTQACVCGDVIPLTTWRAHSSDCPSTKPVAVTFKPVAPTSQEVPRPVNRSTFACPLCAERNFDVRGLVKHVEEHHANSKAVSAVCPVCVAMPWGDPNYRCADFVGHLLLRHQFAYDTYADFNQDEDAILAAILEQSKTQC
eukprot:GILJ01004746.1.p1 GENE.GILJ01004746.1~~GILJ01004746.1.p1  ORF type:complete len:228 (-),score=11.35 GILJ01004746.1:180-821(-)